VLRGAEDLVHFVGHENIEGGELLVCNDGECSQGK
jgi:hypothetical protein